jgi:aminopeptidase N
VLAALTLLADIDRPEREAAFSAFYAAWHHDDLVIDNWFALQARSCLAGTLDRVRVLTSHPAFDMRKPNRVHALVGAFCSANPLHFHAADGGGYDFLADWILRLDPINGQIAAGLVRPLGAWRRFDERRQTLMKQALQRVLAQPGLGNGTREQAGKSLG